jgi:hypothetical protein
MRSENSTARVIRELARRHRVAYVKSGRDVLADHFTRLAGDDVRLDDVEQLLIALQRQGHLTRTEAVRLQARYLRESRP